MLNLHILKLDCYHKMISKNSRWWRDRVGGLWNKIGKFNVIERLVDLNADRKRLWFETLQNVNDGMMIDSMPISLNFVNKSSI